MQSRCRRSHIGRGPCAPWPGCGLLVSRALHPQGRAVMRHGWRLHGSGVLDGRRGWRVGRCGVGIEVLWLRQSGCARGRHRRLRWCRREHLRRRPRSPTRHQRGSRPEQLSVSFLCMPVVSVVSGRCLQQLKDHHRQQCRGDPGSVNECPPLRQRRAAPAEFLERPLGARHLREVSQRLP